ncbi:MAG: CDP-archaeol synthase [Bacteroides sp.]|nr:CDP-archaeol synthase [Bacteroides sp.]
MLDAKKTAVRAVSGAVYVIIIVLACFWGDLGVTLLAGIFGALGVSEFRKMRFPAYSNGGIGLYDVMGGLALIFSPLPSAYAPYPFFFLWIAWLIGRMILTIYSNHAHPEKEFAVDMGAQVYVAFPLALLVAAALCLQSRFDTCMPVLAVFIMIWMNDTGAFLFGSTFGKHRLFERVSPKKSWEGFWGGLFCTVATGAVIGLTGSPLAASGEGNPVLFWTLAGVVVTLAATFGDLFESVIKRNLNLKDSGNLIPGHGGILDRIDSLLMVIPAMILYFYIFSLFIR